MAVFSKLRQVQNKLVGLWCRKGHSDSFPKTRQSIEIMEYRYFGEPDHSKIHDRESNWDWMMFKDMAHLYMSIGVLFFGSVILLSNAFVGPATLAEIPEGYRPKHWEYYKHPISRFIQRYFFDDDQMYYEKYLHHLYIDDEDLKMRFLDEKIEDVMKRKRDYKAFYYLPITADYTRLAHQLKIDEEKTAMDYTYYPEHQHKLDEFNPANLPGGSRSEDEYVE